MLLDRSVCSQLSDAKNVEEVISILHSTLDALLQIYEVQLPAHGDQGRGCR